VRGTEKVARAFAGLDRKVNQRCWRQTNHSPAGQSISLKEEEKKEKDAAHMRRNHRLSMAKEKKKPANCLSRKRTNTIATAAIMNLRARKDKSRDKVKKSSRSGE